MSEDLQSMGDEIYILKEELADVKKKLVEALDDRKHAEKQLEDMTREAY